MGWFSYDIMGGDTPLDAEGTWEDEFGGGYDYDSDENPPPIIPLREGITSDDVRAFANEQMENDWKDDWHIFAQVVGLKMIENGIPMKDGVREGILHAIDAEIEVIPPEHERAEKLNEFRAIVVDYPAAGLSPLKDNPFLKRLPYQEGLMEKIAQTLG
jgi:hypothetical protein